MNSKKVYFNIRPTSRERMWDTIKYANKICDVLLPYGIQQQSSIKTYSKANKNTLIDNIKSFVSSKILNRQAVDTTIVNQADLVYMWGAVPRNINKDFIVELDNPYSLAYYHTDNFQKNKQKIKANLRKAKKITYLSETCKNHTLELLGQEFESKSFVNYPYMEENYRKNNRDDKVINFVFVGLNSRGKGGNELLEAFYHISNENYKLTFISNVADDIKKRYKDDKRIIFLSPQTREKLLNDIYPKMDIMIFPSFYESFGVVLLEALSYGMAIITLNTYATPEIVEDNFNGRLLHHPILKPTILNNKEVVNCVDLKIGGFHKRYLENGEFYFGLYHELKGAIEEVDDNYKRWQENSLKLFEDKFAPKIWIRNFQNIIG